MKKQGQTAAKLLHSSEKKIRRLSDKLSRWNGGFASFEILEEVTGDNSSKYFAVLDFKKLGVDLSMKKFRGYGHLVVGFNGYNNPLELCDAVYQYTKYLGIEVKELPYTRIENSNNDVKAVITKDKSTFNMDPKTMEITPVTDNKGKIVAASVSGELVNPAEERKDILTAPPVKPGSIGDLILQKKKEVEVKKNVSNVQAVSGQVPKLEGKSGSPAPVGQGSKESPKAPDTNVPRVHKNEVKGTTGTAPVSTKPAGA